MQLREDQVLEEISWEIFSSFLLVPKSLGYHHGRRRQRPSSCLKDEEKVNPFMAMLDAFFLMDLTKVLAFLRYVKKI